MSVRIRKISIGDVYPLRTIILQLFKNLSHADSSAEPKLKILPLPP